MATMENLVQQVIQRLSMVTGVAVQTYAADRIAQYIQDRFDIIFDLEWWEQFKGEPLRLGLDGVSGNHTGDIINKIKRFEDIKAIYREGTNEAITKLSSTVNPLSYTGNSPQFYGSVNNPHKVFKVYPIEATGKIDVIYRTKPEPFNILDEVPMDTQLLVFGAALDYATDDEANQTQIQKLLQMYNERLMVIRGNHNDRVTLETSRFNVQTEWY